MVALIAGPCPPPRMAQGLGLPYLAAALEEAGYEAAIFDTYPPRQDDRASDDPDMRLAEAVAASSPSLVGVTIHTPAYAERVHLAKCLRQRLPDALLVAGGHHPTAAPGDLLRRSEFDVCVIGEGERTLVEIAGGVASGRNRRDTDWLTAIRGIACRADGRVLRTPRRRPVANVDALPFPAHHLLGLERYGPHPALGVRSQGLLTYRGCPARCAFCCNPQGRRVRQRAPSRVGGEVERVVRDFGVRGFNVYDNLFGLDRAHAVAVCDEIRRRRLDVVWDCWTAGGLVDAELAARLRRAGCIRVGFGAESGDDEVLARSQRGFTTAQHQAGIRALVAAGLKVQVFLMVGLPGETRASVERTVDFAARCGADDVSLSLHRPWPGTAAWRNPRAFGLRITRGPDFEAYVETESLNRTALLELTEEAVETLTQRGLKCGTLRCDRFVWEGFPRQALGW
ncbi:MAG: radical SAM protein [Armatimonadetes bacterium]|nr:radical SAM protein [Armatimonadota bacterium]